MRVLLTMFAAVLCVAPLEAQRIEPMVFAGLRAPLGGTLIVPVPLPASAGFVIVPRRFSETNGVVFGASVLVPVRGALSVQTGVAVTLAQRTAESAEVTPCPRCATRLTSGQLGLHLRRSVRARVDVEGAVGGELIHLGGEAFASPLHVLAAADVVPARRVVPAANASIGARYALQRGGALRVTAQLRRYSITSRWTDPAFEATAGSIQNEPFTDLLFTIGWSPRTKR